MMEFDSVLAFSEHLLSLELGMHGAVHRALETAGKLLKKDMVEQVGRYQAEAGPYVAWAQLAPSTEVQKAALGAPDDAPLLRFGDLRESFKYEVDGSAELIVGSTDPVMIYHELGTSRMPPRPVVGTALYKHRDKIKALLGHALVEGVMGGALPGELEDFEDATP